MRVGIDARKIADFGIGTYIRGLLGGLVALGTNDEYVAFAPQGAPIPDGVEHIAIDVPHYSMRELLVVGSAANRARLDVFHAPHYVVPFTRVPLVVTIHDLIHLHQPMRNPLGRVYARTMMRRAVKRARRVLTVTEAVKSQLERELGARDVMVTPNGVDRIDGLRARRSSYFAYVGNDKVHKNVDALVEAIALVPDARLVLVGAPFDRFRGRERIDVRGFVRDEELSALYRDAIALVMASHEEGFGLPALEAMAHGTAVITSNDAALVEVTADAALHVDARDVRSLADAMLRVARDADLRERLGAIGVERARRFTWKRCAELTRTAYEAASK
ncbi:MAG TPA: glycosyltransferase family 1 protein [Thermoanaerobaculia bacterium]|nr:glycosyltransferase family 1 protein [Thermoanaerobaculia bacterium]